MERGPGIALQAMQEKKALSWRGRGRLRGFLELRRPWGFSPEAGRRSKGAASSAPGKSGLHARGAMVKQTRREDSFRQRNNFVQRHRDNRTHGASGELQPVLYSSV